MLTNRLRLIYLPWLATCALFGWLSCAHPGVFIHARAADSHTFEALLEQPLRARVLIERGNATSLWPSLSLSNTGPVPIRDIQMWDTAGLPYFASVAGVSKHDAGADRNSFALAPGESFVSSVVVQVVKKLTGNFRWEMPADPALAAAACRRLVQARFEPGQGLRLAPAGGEAFVELNWTSPLPIAHARVAWDAEPARPAPTIWIAIENGAWGRLALPPRGVDWNEGLDLSSTVQGQRAFGLRVAYAGGATPTPPSLLLKHLRVEYDFEQAGDWRPWRRGLNEVSVQYQAPANTHPALAVDLTDWTSAASQTKPAK